MEHIALAQMRRCVIPPSPTHHQHTAPFPLRYPLIASLPRPTHTILARPLAQFQFTHFTSPVRQHIDTSRARARAALELHTSQSNLKLRGAIKGYIAHGLDSFLALGGDVATVDAGAHVVHDDRAGAPVYEDAGGWVLDMRSTRQ